MKTLALSIVMAALTLAQTPQFEVASIRPAKQDGDHDSETDKGFFRTHNLTLKRLIAKAYAVDTRQIFGGPNWMDSYSYDIAAKIPAEFAQQPREKVPLMIQSLLADRFQLAIHREPRQISAYALLLAKKGPKMERAKPEESGSHADSNNTHITAKNVTMEAFANHLSRDIGKPDSILSWTGCRTGWNRLPTTAPRSSRRCRSSLG